MHRRHGTWLIAGASLLAFALGASAQTRPAANAPARPSSPGNLISLLTGALAQTRPPVTFVPPPRGNPGQSQPLPIDRAAAGRVANSAVNTRGRTVNAKFISANAAAINSVQIPVLLPGDPDLAANLRIFPNGPFYTVGSKSAGMITISRPITPRM